MSLGLVHITAVGMTIVMISFLVYLNMEQVEEYDFLRKELDARLAELSCKHKKIEPEPEPELKSSSAHLTDIVKEVVGESILAMMREVNEYFFNGAGLLQLGSADHCMPECDCKSVCQLQGKYGHSELHTKSELNKNLKSFKARSNENSASECEKCRLECSRKFQNERGAMAPPKKCRYSHTHVNYADSHLGARIVAVHGTPFDCGSVVTCIWGSSFGKNPPESILSSNMEPGCCFAFKGMSSVTILLSKPIHVEVVEIAHIDRCRSLSRDTSSAPKDFTVYGVDNETGKEILIGDFVYENTVPIELFTYNGDHTKFQLIKIEFKTNHGNPNYTCVYKVGVYGKEIQ